MEGWLRSVSVAERGAGQIRLGFPSRGGSPVGESWEATRRVASLAGIEFKLDAQLVIGDPVVAGWTTGPPASRVGASTLGIRSLPSGGSGNRAPAELAAQALRAPGGGQACLDDAVGSLPWGDRLGF